jgi:ADP-L-glycero-D-manno-heptose 6-epimerase
MKIILTGHRGFVGSHLLQALQKQNYEVEAYDWENNQFSIMDADWVIHIGAISSTTEKDIEKILKQNYDFTIDLYERCKRFGVNFQFASSASLYGFNNKFSENDPLDPRTPYAWSKYLCERYIQNRMGGSITHIFRYFNVYGPEGEEHKGSQASPYMQFTKQAKETGVIKLFENSENYRRDFIHVSEIVSYHLMFLNSKQSGIFNLGTGSTKSFQEIAEKIAEKYNAKIEYIPMPEILKSSYQKYTCADMTKTNQEILTNLVNFADT